MKLILFIVFLFCYQNLSANKLYNTTNEYLVKYLNYNSKINKMTANDNLKIYCGEKKPYYIVESRTTHVCINFKKIKNVKKVLLLAYGCGNNIKFISYYKIKSNIFKLTQRFDLRNCMGSKIDVVAYVQTKNGKIYYSSSIMMLSMESPGG